MNNLLLLIGGLVIGYIFIMFYEAGYRLIHKKIGKEPIVSFMGYHLHHSLYGVGLFFLFLFMQNFLLLGAGVGIILRHTYAERKFKFIDKN